MTMEYVTGWNLEEFLDRHVETEQYIPADLAVFIVSRICRGLGYAHRKKDSQGRLLGIVHRDVNPKNIMIAQEGDVKLTDFGIAKALDLMYNKEGDVIAGKDEYLSPEQARCEVTDHRADLFCCGIVMSELLLGYNLFEAYESEDTIRNILEMKVPNFKEIRPDIDPRLDKILQTSLMRAREERYQSSEEMLTELESFIYGEGYGPTNEKLAAYIYDVFGDDGENAALRWHRGETRFADN
jgi:serine/threonine-protein kinase